MSQFNFEWKLLLSRGADGNADLTTTVPNNEIWKVYSIYVDYTSNLNSSTRQMEVQFIDDNSNILSRPIASITQKVGNREYYWNISVADFLDFRDSDKLLQQLSFHYLFPNYSLRVFDNNGVSGNTIDVAISGVKRSVDAVN